MTLHRHATSAIALLLLAVLLLIFGATDAQADGPETCAWPAKCGSGGGSIPGVTGNVGNEDFVEYLYGLTAPPISVDGPTYFFSETNAGAMVEGLDTNDGLTTASPFQTWGKAITVCFKANCIFDTEDFTFGAGQDFDNANTNFCVPGSMKPLAKMSSITPGVPWRLVQAGLASVAPIHIGCGGAYNTAGGIMILADLQCSGMGMSGCVIIDDGIKFFGSNISSVNTVGGSSSVLRLAENSAGVCINCSGKTSGAFAIQVIDDGGLTWISRKSLLVDPVTGAGSDTVVIASSNRSPTTIDRAGATFIGTDFTGAPASAFNNVPFQVSPTANSQSALVLAHVNANRWDLAAGTGTIDIRPGSTADATFDVLVRRSTLSSARSLLNLAVQTATDTSNAANRVDIRWSILQPGTAVVNMLFSDEQLHRLGTFIVEDNVLSNPVGPLPALYYRYRNGAGLPQNANSRSGFRSNVAADPDTDTIANLARFFADGGNIEVDNVDQFIAGSCPQCRCDETAACGGALTGTFDVPLEGTFYKEFLPGLEQDVTLVRLPIERYGY